MFFPFHIFPYSPIQNSLQNPVIFEYHQALINSCSPHLLVSSSPKFHTSWKKTGGRRPSGGGPQSIIHDFLEIRNKQYSQKTQQIIILSKTTQILEKTISSGCNLETKQFSSSPHLLISSSPHPLISSSSKSHTSWKKTGGRRPSGGGPQSIIHDFLEIRNKQYSQKNTTNNDIVKNHANP